MPCNQNITRHRQRKNQTQSLRNTQELWHYTPFFVRRLTEEKHYVCNKYVKEIFI